MGNPNGAVLATGEAGFVKSNLVFSLLETGASPSLRIEVFFPLRHELAQHWGPDARLDTQRKGCMDLPEDISLDAGRWQVGKGPLVPVVAQ